MRCIRLLTVALALSGFGGLHAAAHAVIGDHSHVHDEATPHSHGHDADHHDHDLQLEGGSQARLLPARSVLPPRADASVALCTPALSRGPIFSGLKAAPSRGGAPPGRRVPPLSARAPPA
jgi:hypothetical protein